MEIAVCACDEVSYLDVERGWIEAISIVSWRPNDAHRLDTLSACRGSTRIWFVVDAVVMVVTAN